MRSRESKLVPMGAEKDMDRRGGRSGKEEKMFLDRVLLIFYFSFDNHLGATVLTSPVLACFATNYCSSDIYWALSAAVSKFSQ